MLTVIILQYNHPELTSACVTALRRYCKNPGQVIVIDNQSPDHSARNIALPNNVQFMQNETNEGFGGANNRAAKMAAGDVLLFLNNDTVCHSDFIAPVLKIFEARPEIGIVGPRLVYTDGTLQLSGGSLPSIRREFMDKILYVLSTKRLLVISRLLEKRYGSTRKVEWVSGAALFIRRQLFEDLGGFDTNMFMYFEDKDLCKRAHEKGFDTLYETAVSVVHLGGGSTEGAHSGSTEKYYRQSQQWYYKKHRPHIDNLLLKIYLKLQKRKYL
jgi:GT2 family glycosyltransferase